MGDAVITGGWYEVDCGPGSHGGGRADCEPMAVEMKDGLDEGHEDNAHA